MLTCNGATAGREPLDEQALGKKAYTAMMAQENQVAFLRTGNCESQSAVPASRAPSVQLDAGSNIAPAPQGELHTALRSVSWPAGAAPLRTL